MLSFLLNQIWIGLMISFELIRNFRISFGTAGYCIDQFVKSVEIVHCVSLNAEPCLNP